MKTENSISKEGQKFSMIENWKASGQSQQLFCKENQIVYSNFHYWFKKYKAQQEGSPDELFLPVQIKKTLPSPSGSVVIELVLSDGRHLNFYRMVDISYLRALQYLVTK